MQISGSMFLMEVREKEDEEVSSETPTLQLGSPAKSRYVCPGHPDCGNIDCDLCEDPETEAEDVKEADDESARQYEILNSLGMEWKEANDAKLGEVKGNGRSGGRAAPKKDREENDKDKWQGAGDAGDAGAQGATVDARGDAGDGTAIPQRSKRWKLLAPSNFPRRSQPYHNNAHWHGKYDVVLQPDACAFNRGFMPGHTGGKGFKVRK